MTSKQSYDIISSAYFGAIALDCKPEDASRRFSNYQSKSGLRGRVLFAVEYLPDAVSVMEHVPPGVRGGEKVFADQLLWEQYKCALHGPEKDLALFAKMSLACILVGSANIQRVLLQTQNGPIEDRQLPKAYPGIVGERYLVAANSQKFLAVFILDLDGLLAPADLAGVMARLLQLRMELDTSVYGFCVVNHQRHLEPSLRQEVTNLGEDLDGLLSSCGISLTFATHLSRYLLGSRDHDWPLDSLQEAIRKRGYCSCSPPNTLVIGEFVRPFPRQSAIGIRVLAPVEEGCHLYVRTEDGFKLVTAESVQVGKNPVKNVRDGLAGVKINANVDEVVEGSLESVSKPA